MSEQTNQIIIALDVDSPAEALDIVARLGPPADFYKVGMELYAAAGMDIVRALADQGKRIFLDLKLYDIGETVKRATSQICKSGLVTLMTVHGSRAIMQAAVEGRADSRTKLLAVTVLTSFDADDLADLGFSTSVSELVELRVKKAAQAGIDGIVCSPLEGARVRAIGGSHLTLVTPGVRSPGASKCDQKRVATPAEAVRDGADFVVIGRQITRASNPHQAFDQVLAEIASAQVTANITGAK